MGYDHANPVNGGCPLPIGQSITLDRLGRVVIPVEYRRHLGLKPGDKLRAVMEDGEIRLVTLREVVRRAQEEFRKYVPAGRLLSEELSEDRRREAANE